MNNMRVYHGFVTLIPGTLILVVILISLVPSDWFNEQVLTTFEIGKMAYLLPLAIIAAFLFGVCFWDLSYLSPRFSLAPQYMSLAEGMDKRYVERINAVNNVLENSGHPRSFDISKKGKIKFRQELVRATESHPEFLGKRIVSEWQRLGLYIAIGFTCKFGLVFLGVGYGVGRLLKYESIAVQHHTFTCIYAGTLLVLMIVAPFAFSRRNRFFGRNVGLAMLKKAECRRNKANRQLLVVDFDGVIADTNKCKAVIASEDFGIKIDSRECSRSFFLQKGHSLEVYEKIAEKAYSFENTLRLEEVPGALESLQSLMEGGWRVVILTELSGIRLTAARVWLDRKLHPAKLDIYSSHGFSVSKVSWADSSGAVAFIDDDPRHFDNLASCDLRAFLFNPLEAASSSIEIPKVGNWKEILAILAP